MNIQLLKLIPIHQLRPHLAQIFLKVGLRAFLFKNLIKLHLIIVDQTYFRFILGTRTKEALYLFKVQTKFPQ